MQTTPTPKEGQLLVGPLFNEPMLVETVRPGGPDLGAVGLVGSRTRQFRRVQLSGAELALLRIVDSARSISGDPQLLRLAVQAYALVDKIRKYFLSNPHIGLPPPDPPWRPDFLRWHVTTGIELEVRSRLGPARLLRDHNTSHERGIVL